MSKDLFICYRCNGEGVISDRVIQEGSVEECPLCEGEGYTEERLDKKPRWRKIIKVSESHVSRLIDRCYWYENANTTSADGTLSEQEMFADLDMLYHYGNIIERTTKIDMVTHQKEWVQILSNFTD